MRMRCSCSETPVRPDDDARRELPDADVRPTEVFAWWRRREPVRIEADPPLCAQPQRQPVRPVAAADAAEDRVGSVRLNHVYFSDNDETRLQPICNPAVEEDPSKARLEQGEWSSKVLQTEAFRGNGGLRRKGPILDRTQEVAGSGPARSTGGPDSNQTPRIGSAQRWSAHALSSGVLPVSQPVPRVTLEPWRCLADT
jgi:hypothetical protein